MAPSGTGSAVIDSAAAENLAATLRGPVYRPQDAGYETVRPVYNAMIDRHPQLIAQCADVTDVRDAVRVAAALDTDVAVRGGAHNGGGLGTCDGLVLDLSLMNGIRIDPEARLAYVGGGA